MKTYTIENIVIPQDQRAEINDKISALICSNQTQGITSNDIFNLYTGDGGLHGLDRNDYSNYWEFSKAKKEIENGQFFTPHSVCKYIADLVSPKIDDTIADITCGMGNFFNYFTEENCYGNDIDRKAIDVAQYLYPKANIVCDDLKYYEPNIKVDYVLGNPPFNIQIDNKLSQSYFFEKTEQILKPGGLVLAIVPKSFLSDEFFNRTYIELLNTDFNFIGQIPLDKKTFIQMGVKSFETKVMCFQKKSDHFEESSYKSIFTTYERLKAKIDKILSNKKDLKAKLINELVLCNQDNQDFVYKVKKYLFEIKHQPLLRKHLPKAINLLDRLKNQKPPDNCSKDERERYEKSKLTEKKVIRSLKIILKKQLLVQEDKIRLVKTNYSIKYKAYSGKSKKQLDSYSQKEWLINDLVIGLETLPQSKEFKGFQSLINRKQNLYNNQLLKINKVSKNDNIDKYLNEFSFLDKELNKCYFNDIQKNDMNCILPKSYAILAWQMGGGKTAAAISFAKFKPQQYTFVVSASLAIKMTWVPVLKINNIPFKLIESIKDIESIQPGDFVLLTFHFISKYKKQLMKLVKMKSNKINLIFDESDEITNHASKRTKAVKDIFKKAKRKLLTTGTTTRNNISELYSQLELLYNNSYNFISWSEEYHTAYFDKEEREQKLKKQENPYFQKPFPAKYGATTFKRCFNPSKSTVFGIQKQNQNLFNENELTQIIEKTILTRKFKEIAGDKYYVENIQVRQDLSEREVYRTIMKEFHSISRDYFKSTGNSRKDALLRIIRQLTLMIEATSTPQLFDFYSGPGYPNKARKIIQIIEQNKEKIAIGCTSIKAVDWYEGYIKRNIRFRKVFIIKGDVSFEKRKSIISEFEETEDGILICTQQSLKSSVNIPTCNIAIIESLQWNIPKIEQFYFRFIRYNSKEKTRVIFINYSETIEMNMLALLMAKERLNDYVKSLDYKENSEIYDEYGIDLDILNDLITKTKDEKGNVSVEWGKSNSL